MEYLIVFLLWIVIILQMYIAGKLFNDIEFILETLKRILENE